MQYKETLRLLQIVRRKAGPVLASDIPVRVPTIIGSILEEIDHKVAFEGVDQAPEDTTTPLAEELRGCIPLLQQEGYPVNRVTLSAYYILNEVVKLNRKGAAMLEIEKPEGQLTMDIAKGMRILAGSILGLYQQIEVTPEDLNLESGEAAALFAVEKSLRESGMPPKSKAEKIMDWQTERLENAMYQRTGFVEDHEQALAVYAGGVLGREIYGKIYPIAEKIATASS